MIPANRRPGARSIRRASSRAAATRRDPGPVHPDVDVDDHRDVDARRGRRPRWRGRTWNGSSAQIMTSARAWRRAARSTLSRVASSLATRTLGIPPSTMTSASETLAQVTPIAPKSIWRRAIHGDLWPLEWGRQSLPPAAMALDESLGRWPRTGRGRAGGTACRGPPSVGRPVDRWRRGWSWPRVSPANGTAPGPCDPARRHCRLSTIAPHGDHDGGRRLGHVLGREDGAGQPAFGLVDVGRRARRWVACS